MGNRLARETSPYLLQHAHNPVDWYPWGEEALRRARGEDRPILLSIGYSACHWCHVMERESFEDPDVAALMNRLFVNVKVDREERPDLDAVYMRAVQTLTGQGGWPLTAFLTPDGLPYYGGTYFPPESRHGLPSFRQVLEAAGRAYHDRKDQVTASAEELRSLIRRSMTAPSVSGDGPPELDHGFLDQAYRRIAARFDQTHGGFGQAPKFPQPVVLEVLLRHHARTGSRDARHMLVHTLRKMAAGGMHDHLAGGFHRYSVDARWLVPHFEKMLYDNALLARIYLGAHLVTGEGDLGAVAERTLDWILTDMRTPEGGFCSAWDADSEGEEGLFYVWTPAEVGAVLAEDDARLFMRCYDVTEGGNFEGRNILHTPHDLAAVARSEGMSSTELESRLGAARKALLEVRSRREPPLRDDKILTGWNAMTIRALAEAGAALGRDDFVDAARGAADFLLGTAVRDGGVLRTTRDGTSKIPGFLEDHAGLANALLTLHEATLEPRWLEESVRLADHTLSAFWDAKQRMFFDTMTGGEALVVRPRDVTDSATPSGNSLAVELLLRLGTALDRDDYRAVARTVLESEASMAERLPAAFGRFLSALDFHLSDPLEVALIGAPGDPGTNALLDVVHRRYLPNRVVVGRDPDGPDPVATPLLQGRTLRDGRPTAYVCRSYACQEPVTEPGALAAQLP